MAKPSGAKPSGRDTDARPETEANQVPAVASATRRQALKNIAYAASVAPAMVVLLKGEVSAQGFPGTGKGKGGGGGGGGPNCDNPGLHLGFNRNGHSAC